MGKYVFNTDWLYMEEYSEWLKDWEYVRNVFICACGCSKVVKIPRSDCHKSQIELEYEYHENMPSSWRRETTEVIMLDGLIVVYRSNVDLFFYVMGSCHENELILVSVLNCLYDAVNQILKKNVERRTLLENLDVILLAIDEICDGGIVLEADSTSVVQRVAVRSDDIPLGEQTVAQVLQSAKEQLKWSLLK
ncbi:coatomer subunit zeta-1-like [Stegodyphus dumicola]|uniref:coatomer subunit zeta-1-like n=1 Tax=Stegodyphus dumicola TaxID=202533 RepID=UPI0015B21B9F|nr:coatomer subunit zeta-1-like [Stegodyphus dumicola]